MSDAKSDSLIVVGGVGCNERLQEMMKTMCEERGAKVGCMDERFCIDNGIMIAYTGFLEYNSTKDKSVFSVENVDIDQRFRTDQVFVSWRH